MSLETILTDSVEKTAVNTAIFRVTVVSYRASLVPRGRQKKTTGVT